MQLQCLSGFQPLIFPLSCPHNSYLAHTQRLDGLRRAAGAQLPDLADVHEYAFARLADEVHIFENWPVVSVFEVRPYSALRLPGFYELFWVGSLDCAAGDVGEETRA